MCPELAAVPAGYVRTVISSASEFVALRTSEDPAEYRRAAHEEASFDVWVEVVDAHPDMRRWVAHNKTVPVQVLELLAQDADPDVRAVVAGKRKFPLELAVLLSRDIDEGVRLRVAHNPKVHDDVLQILAEDECWMVREAARERLASVGAVGRREVDES